MDWDSANVGLDPEAFKAAQAASDANFGIPLWIFVIAIIVFVILAFTIAKKSKDSGGSSQNEGGDKQ